MATSLKCHVSRLFLWHSRRVGSQLRNVSVAPSHENSEEPQYPPIKPRYPPGKWGGASPKWAWKHHDRAAELRAIPKAKERVEEMAHTEKQYQYHVKAYDSTPYTLEFKQYVTKSHLVLDQLPLAISGRDVDGYLPKFQSLLEDAILAHHHHYKHSTDRDAQISSTDKHCLLHQLFNTLLIGLAPENDYLIRTQLDERVRVETFWARGGFVNGEKPVLGNDGHQVVSFQYHNEAAFQIRAELPLAEFISIDDPLCTEGSLPAIDYGPPAVGLALKKSKPITVSGHWMGDPCEFSLMSCYVLPAVFRDFAENTNEAATTEQLLQYGLTSSFASCVAQSYNQGFNRYLDLTYPFTTQTIVTDGQHFNLFAYQLNTLGIWRPDDGFELRNICWALPRMKLYEAIEDGRVVGFNPEVLQVLLQFFLNSPQDRGVDLRPYLPEETAPKDVAVHINAMGTEPLERPVIGRFQYRPDSVYF